MKEEIKASNEAKPRRKSLLEAKRAANEAAARRSDGAERAVLVAVEFTGERRRLTSAALDARKAASLLSEQNALSMEDGAARVLATGIGELPEDSVAELDLSFADSLAEFQELANSAGAVVAATLVQRRPRPDAATLVGKGKLDEIVATVESNACDLVLIDHDLTPSQLRNLEGRLPCRVIDRTQLILDIFARHARTREGQLQVELAQLQYQLPRLAGRGKTMSQLGGGIGTRGPGETKLETDRRRINARIDHLKDQLESVRRIRRQQRQRREAVPVPVVALVGYTNAGKSTLFNALTEAGVLESARMFATLDPKLRQLQLPSRRKVLLSDTVGFIRNLPHTLVTSFRATLEEVERAELLVHVQDVSSRSAAEQRDQVRRVLAELEVAKKPILEVLNKVDLLSEQERQHLGTSVVAVSSLTGTGIERLLKAIDDALPTDEITQQRFRIPQSEGTALAALEAGAILDDISFEGNLVRMSVRGPTSLLGRYRRFIDRSLQR